MGIIRQPLDEDPDSSIFGIAWTANQYGGLASAFRRDQAIRRDLRHIGITRFVKHPVSQILVSAIGQMAADLELLFFSQSEEDVSGRNA